MRKILPCYSSMILKNGHVFESLIQLKVLDTLRCQTQKSFYLRVARVPQLVIMFRILDQHFVRTHGTHAVVDAISLALRVALDAVQRGGMNNRACRPSWRRFRRYRADHLRGVLAARTETAGRYFGLELVFFGVVTSYDPRPCDGIFAQLHSGQNYIARDSRQLWYKKWLKTGDIRPVTQAIHPVVPVILQSGSSNSVVEFGIPRANHGSCLNWCACGQA